MKTFILGFALLSIVLLFSSCKTPSTAPPTQTTTLLSKHDSASIINMAGKKGLIVLNDTILPSSYWVGYDTIFSSDTSVAYPVIKVLYHFVDSLYIVDTVYNQYGNIQDGMTNDTESFHQILYSDKDSIQLASDNKYHCVGSFAPANYSPYLINIDNINNSSPSMLLLSINSSEDTIIVSAISSPRSAVIETWKMGLR